ncbi:MAG TPA: hypothetical protein PLN06_02565 [Bacteroidales bacterium]|nr:hypothetical protein [Bacteroidales bacterium]HCI54471.1 hypothetical protein [Bacteroidales bacterium]HOU95492.1 hypothetical protein [Bacteroidales bacterium]HQG36253.1 hypothetical protein [Bacteroidales bacterium]HQG52255.1 hypothetical protein [Bacteroidales bacterium]
MKKLLSIFLCSFLLLDFLKGQATDPLTGKCVMNAGPNTTYLKDFRVQLGKSESQNEFRYKQVFALSKNMKYKFTLCNDENSPGELIMKLVDDTGRTVLQSFDPKTGKTYSSVEFVCNKTGTYKLFFDFRGFQQGLGVGIVSLVK